MSIVDRVASLKTKHTFLETAIQQERHRPLPDLFLLRDLKVRKLRVKEELARLNLLPRS